MIKPFLFFLSISAPLIGFSQNKVTYNTLDIKTPVGAVIDFSEKVVDLDPKLTLIEAAAPAPHSKLKNEKIKLDQNRAAYIREQKQVERYGKSSPYTPQLLANFIGNFSQGTPNDNDVAISNGGKIVSVVNSNVYIYNDSGVQLQQKTLSHIANTIGGLNRTFDPRVIYDPKKDRFILVFLQGSTSTDTRIITGFSKTNDPTGLWNFYAIPGNIFGDNSWSDYPIISLSNDELFITVNRLRDNTSWQEGFIESLVWQVDKQTGYDGDSLTQRVYKDILFNDKPIWSVCPAKGGETTFGPNMYFLSVRPSDLSNDTIFLHEITNTIASGNATFNTRVLKLPMAYGLQPNATQPNGRKLQTNDARVLSAMFQEERIHFVSNCINPTTFAPGIYYGIIRRPWETTPTFQTKIISYDTMDIGYPSIAHMGGGVTDNSALITFSYVSPRSFPGTAAVFIDRNGEVSEPIIAKKGLNNIQIIADSVQRWGDYTGNQRRYNEPGVCWISGSYGDANGNNRTWIAEIKSTDPFLNTKEAVVKPRTFVVSPNPAREYVSIEFEMQDTRFVEFELTDISGKQPIKLLRDKAKAGKNQFSIAVSDLASGIYFINIVSNGQRIESRKIVVSH